jgi:condensin complex subunit 2
LNKNEESSWQKASASLDASAKIYGYRVDSVHSETFKFLGGLSRADAKDENNQDGEYEKKEKKERSGKHDGYLTLERDPRKLDLAKYDLEFDVDPLFKSMTARFSEAGARGLLLNNLPLDQSLDVLLECKHANQEEKKKENSDFTELSTELKSVVDCKL